MVRPRRAWTRIAAWGGAVAVLLGLAILLVYDAKIAGVTSMFVGLAGLAVTLLQMARQPPGQPQASPVDEAARLDNAAEQLAGAVTAKWRAEAGLQALRRPAPLRLTWATTTRPVAAPAETIAAATLPGRVVRLHLRGHLDEVADKFLALPQRRLVVLGEPGAGKTVLALLLTLELLERRRPGQPVPVLLGLSSWDPTNQHLHTWIACRLDEDYPALTSPAYGPDAALELVTSGRILPVLDGLDELREPLRPTAIGELDRVGADQPMVVTCRGREYQQAVEAGGGALAAAAVVELQPVTPAEAIDFLRTTAAPAPERWDRIAADLRAHPDGALAAALSTPLMVALARTIYASPGRHPSELVGLARADHRAVERHLLDGFIPAAYTNRPPAPGTRAPTSPRPLSPDLAHHWLAWLATHLHQHRIRDLAWWQLPSIMTMTQRSLTQTAARFGIGFTVGFAAGFAVGSAVGFAATLRFGPVVGLWGGLTLGLVVGIGFGLVGGVGLGFLAELPRLRDTAELLAAMRRDRAERSAVASAFPLPDGRPRLVAPRARRREGRPRRRPVSDVLAATPRSDLRQERAITIRWLVYGLVGVAVLWVMANVLLMGEPEPEGTLGGLLVSGLVLGLVLGLMVVFLMTHWGRFTIARAWLAVRGKLPWRLMAFLDDAHRRGVLRQDGVVYQFRHARLQDHLADASLVSHTDR